MNPGEAARAGVVIGQRVSRVLERLIEGDEGVTAPSLHAPRPELAGLDEARKYGGVLSAALLFVDSAAMGYGNHQDDQLGVLNR